ncbi:MAG: hypothetical protein JW820_07575 [Spirochaetales bacterium]|nr:hypothetical protein [Spirochaetales bacterium]
MVDRRRAMDELRRSIRQREAETEDLLGQLGEYLSYQPAERFAATPLADTHRRITELRERLPETRRQVKRILQCVARSEELEKSLRAARSQLAELEEAGERICEEIGHAAFEAYRSTRPEEAEYERIFGPLLKQEEEVSGLEQEMQRVQSGTKGGTFFRIFRESGRTLYVKGLMSLKKKSMAKAYREAGHRFCDSELIKGVKDPEIRQTLGPYQKNQEKQAGLHEEMRTLRSRQEALWKELKDLGAERSHLRRVREIEHQIQGIEEELDASLGSLGRMFRSKPLKSFAEDPEIKKILRHVTRVEKSTEEHRKQIGRIEAAIQLDALDKQRVNLESRVERLEREIESRKGEIASLRQQIQEASEQARRLEALRGPEESLFRLTQRPEQDEEGAEE